MWDADFELTRFLFQRALGFVYFIAFLIAFNQFPALCGKRGLLPASQYLKRLSFTESPTLFFWGWADNDRALRAVAGFGVVLSLAAMVGLSDAFTTGISMAVWGLLWASYLSYVNAGRLFYGYGWETLLLETGFLAIFLGPTAAPASALPIWLLRWVLFRLMFGAGLIKLRGDACWHDLTCMQYHYETQPLPNPLSRAFHHLPASVHKASVLFTHFVELIVPFGYFMPIPVARAAGAVTILFQGVLILSGNLSWLNVLTIVIAISCFDDGALASLSGLQWTATEGVVPGVPGFVVYAVALLVLGLSVHPVRNLFSGGQMMNASFEPLHLVNTYGAFGSVTYPRYEVVIEGTSDARITATTIWKPYEFKAKPGNPRRRPRFVTPYHFKLDWQMWFAAMSPYWNHAWILHLAAKLLQGDPQILKLMGRNPFPGAPPRYIRAEWYEYHFTDRHESDWWKRKRVAAYFPPVSLEREDFRALLDSMGWLPEEKPARKAA